MRKVLFGATVIALSAGLAGTAWACGDRPLSAQQSTAVPVLTAQTPATEPMTPVPAERPDG